MNNITEEAQLAKEELRKEKLNKVLQQKSWQQHTENLMALTTMNKIKLPKRFFFWKKCPTCSGKVTTEKRTIYKGVLVKYDLYRYSCTKCQYESAVGYDKTLDWMGY
jgi:hypothetical protein